MGRHTIPGASWPGRRGPGGRRLDRTRPTLRPGAQRVRGDAAKAPPHRPWYGGGRPPPFLPRPPLSTTRSTQYAETTTHTLDRRLVEGTIEAWRLTTVSTERRAAGDGAVVERELRRKVDEGVATTSALTTWATKRTGVPGEGERAPHWMLMTPQELEQLRTEPFEGPDEGQSVWDTHRRTPLTDLELRDLDTEGELPPLKPVRVAYDSHRLYDVAGRPLPVMVALDPYSYGLRGDNADLREVARRLAGRVDVTQSRQTRASWRQPAAPGELIIESSSDEETPVLNARWAPPADTFARMCAVADLLGRQGSTLSYEMGTAFRLSDPLGIRDCYHRPVDLADGVVERLRAAGHGALIDAEAAAHATRRGQTAGAVAPARRAGRRP